MPRTTTINGKQFQVMSAEEAGIVAGMVLDAAAAKHLFQVRSENVGNNLRKRLKDAEAEGKSDADLQSIVTEYDQKYSFSMPSEGGSTRRMDPLERECRALAVQKIRQQLEAKGRKYSDVKKEKPEALEAKIAEVAEMPEIVKLAKRRLAEAQKAGADALELDL